MDIIDKNSWYDAIGQPIAAVSSTLVFLASWVYCFSEYGYLMGVGLGWLPSIIVALIAYALIRLLWGFFLVGLIWAAWHFGFFS